MERDRSSPNLTQEQQQQLEQQKEQQKTQHQEQHLPQVMGQVNNELDKNPGAKQALAQLAPQQQSELKQQVAQAAFRGSGKNAPQIDYIGISKKDGSLVMQANKYFISNFDIPKSSLPQQPQARIKLRSNPPLQCSKPHFSTSRGLFAAKPLWPDMP